MKQKEFGKKNMKKISTVRTKKYEAILSEKGLTIKDCQILGFRFENGKKDIFHFKLMSSNLPYVLYDGATMKVKVFIVEDIADQIRALAEEVGGVVYYPTPLNDYE